MPRFERDHQLVHKLGSHIIVRIDHADLRQALNDALSEELRMSPSKGTFFPFVFGRNKKASGGYCWIFEEDLEELAKTHKGAVARSHHSFVIQRAFCFRLSLLPISVDNGCLAAVEFDPLAEPTSCRQL